MSLGRPLLFAVILTSLQAMAWLPLLIHRISPVAFAAESVGYRYFHSYRLLHDDTSGLWLPQGQTLGVIHEGGQKLLDWAGITALRARISFFSYGTFALNSFILGLAAWSLSRALLPGWRLRLLWAATVLFGVYGSPWGLTSARLPDYYTFEVTLTAICLGFFMRGLQQANPSPSAIWAGAMGILAGAMIGIKITLLPAALLPLLPCLMSTRASPVQFLRWAGCWSAGCASMLTVVIAVYYQLDFTNLAEAFRAWRSFVSSPGAEPGFVNSLLHPLAAGSNPSADHRFVLVFFILWLVAMVLQIHALVTEPAHRRARLVLAFYALICSSLHLWALFKRPAETTLFETALFFVAVAAALLASLPAASRKSSLWLTLAFGWCLISGLRHFPSSSALAAMNDTGRNAWEIHEWLTATGQPIVVLLPDNRYVSGTVEEILLKGFSDSPTWNITSGATLLDRIAPRRLFVSQLSDVPPGVALLWTDVPGVKPLADLSKSPAVVLGRSPLQVRSWPMMRNPSWSRTVHAAIFAAPSDHSTETAVQGAPEWRDSIPGNPLAGFSISPADMAPRVELRSDGGRRAVRITATKPSPYLALSGSIPPLPDGFGPLRLQSTLRVSTTRLALWQIYDIADAQGTVETVVEPITARASDWTTWSIQKTMLRYPSSTDNFSVGIVNVQPGDWFEVAELTLRAHAASP